MAAPPEPARAKVGSKPLESLIIKYKKEEGTLND
jgi:hypothetical protein